MNLLYEPKVENRNFIIPGDESRENHIINNIYFP